MNSPMNKPFQNENEKENGMEKDNGKHHSNKNNQITNS
jgi:hypothetical protein